MKILKLLPLVSFLLTLCAAPLAADNKAELVPSLHTYGVELDLAWRPIVLLPQKQTTFWFGAEALYKSWNYFHNPVTGSALSSADESKALNKDAVGLWFAGISQGLIEQGSEKGFDGHAWQDPDFLEVFGYYKGILFKKLSAGSYLSDSSQADKNGYVATSFLGGVAINKLTEFNLHNLNSGFVLEWSAETAPRALQTVAVDYQRTTGIFTAFVPVFDLEPTQSLNVLSGLFGVNLAYDHLWGSAIPSEAQQLIGGRAWGGVGGWNEGVGGAVRGVESGRFDGNDKLTANLELRLNLPGFTIPSPFDLPLIPAKVDFIPGILLFNDYGAWNGLKALQSDYLSTAGAGIYLKAAGWGSLVLYYSHWVVGGSNYDGSSSSWNLSLGMQF